MCDAFITYSYRHSLPTSLSVLWENALTCLGLCVVVCAPNQLKCLLKSHGVLGWTVQRFDAADESGHLPFGLTGGWRQERLVALVQGAGPHRVCHSQHWDLGGGKRKPFILPWKGVYGCLFICFLNSRRARGVRKLTDFWEFKNKCLKAHIYPFWKGLVKDW